MLSIIGIFVVVAVLVVGWGILSYLLKSCKKENIRYDYLSKDELIDHIGEMKYKKLDISNLATDTKDIEIENKNLVPIEIEYYEKIKEVLPLYKKPENGKKYKRKYVKYCNIQPEFPAQTLIDQSNIIYDSDNIDYDFLEDFAPSSEFNNGNITVKEYLDSFAENLTNNKDMIGLSKVILKKMNKYHQNRIVKSYNDIFKKKEDISKNTMGKGTLIYKESKKGPKDELGSFRMIITVPVVVNHFHRILNLRLTKYIIDNNIMDTEVQKGGITGQKVPILQHIFKVKSALKHSTRTKNKAAVMFLDITNAYGSLDRDALYVILKNYGIDESFIDYIKNYYDSFEYYVKTKKWTASQLKMNVGLLQGDPLSALLFVTALNSVFTHLNKKYLETHGYKLTSDENIMIMAYIDDICLVTNSKESLEEVYFELKDLLGRMGFKLHPKKSGTMLVNHKDHELTEIDDIPNVPVYKYLGEYIVPDGSSEKTYDSVKKMLNGRLSYINKKKYTNEQKLSFLSEQIIPWLRRKTSVMYDLTRDEKLKFINIIRYHCKDWGITNNIRIFSDIKELFADVRDSIITKCLLEDINELDISEEVEIDEYLPSDKDDDKYEDFVLKPEDMVKFDYKEIENDDKIEL